MELTKIFLALLASTAPGVSAAPRRAGSTSTAVAVPTPTVVPVPTATPSPAVYTDACLECMNPKTAHGNCAQIRLTCDMCSSCSKASFLTPGCENYACPQVKKVPSDFCLICMGPWDGYYSSMCPDFVTGAECDMCGSCAAQEWMWPGCEKYNCPDRPNPYPTLPPLRYTDKCLDCINPATAPASCATEDLSKCDMCASCTKASFITPGCETLSCPAVKKVPDDICWTCIDPMNSPVECPKLTMACDMCASCAYTDWTVAGCENYDCPNRPSSTTAAHAAPTA